MTVKLKEVDELHLIFEGVDNVGKSTLIDAFDYFTEQDWNIHKFSKPKSREDAKKQYEDYLTNILEKEKFTIADRAFYGEIVYGELFRNYKSEYIFDIDREYAKLKNSFVVLCHAPVDWITKHWDGVELNGGELEKLQKTQEKFFNVVQRSAASVIYINMYKFDNNREGALNYLINRLNERCTLV